MIWEFGARSGILLLFMHLNDAYLAVQVVLLCIICNSITLQCVHIGYALTGHVCVPGN